MSNGKKFCFHQKYTGGDGVGLFFFLGAYLQRKESGVDKDGCIFWKAHSVSEQCSFFSPEWRATSSHTTHNVVTYTTHKRKGVKQYFTGKFDEARWQAW